MNPFWETVLQNAIVAIFTLLQTLMLIVIGAAFKTYIDMKQAKRDLSQAFKKLRILEKRIDGLHATTLGTPETSCRESEK